MKYRKATSKLYKALAVVFVNTIAKYKNPVYIHFTFIRGTKHKFDYINPAQTVQDDMVKNGWIEDDSCEFLIPCFEEYQYDKKNPGVIIEIKEEYNERKTDK